jgi:5-methylcytosine-specific restriction endonuclease McrA
MTLPTPTAPMRHLEIHHITPYSLGGTADPANLVRICSHHHDQITFHDATLVGTHPNWIWQPGSSDTG